MAGFLLLTKKEGRDYHSILAAPEAYLSGLLSANIRANPR
jgi:hypothetical protein